MLHVKNTIAWRNKDCIEPTSNVQVDTVVSAKIWRNIFKETLVVVSGKVVFMATEKCSVVVFGNEAFQPFLLLTNRCAACAIIIPPCIRRMKRIMLDK